MRDQMTLAQECLEVELRRESVLDFLRSKGFISPAATWQRLQLNYLERQPNKLTKGNGDIMGRKITLDQKERAVTLAINGGDPIKFLQECGSRNPVNMWNVIKMNVKQKDPETYAKIPDQRKNGAKKRNEKKDEPTVEPEEVETFHVEEVDEDEPAILTARVATEDTVHVKVKKITKPVNYDGFDVCGVRGKFGKYSFSDINGKQWLDFDDPSGDTLSYPVEDWKDFLAELRKAAAVLGVEL